MLVLEQMGEPDSPSAVIQGNLPVHRYLGLEDVRSLHERAVRAA